MVVSLNNKKDMNLRLKICKEMGYSYEENNLICKNCKNWFICKKRLK